MCGIQVTAYDKYRGILVGIGCNGVVFMWAFDSKAIYSDYRKPH